MDKIKAFDIDLKRLFFEVLKRAWLIILVGVICAGSAFAYAKLFITPQYTATVSIYLQNYTGENDQKIYSSDLSASQTLIPTYSELITSNKVLEQVVAKLDNRYTVAQIKNAFSASAVKDTAILKISIRHNVPEEAANIVNAIADIAPTIIMDYAEGSSVKVVDGAKIPQDISYPSYFQLIAISFLLGAAVTFFIIVLLFIFNSYIDNEEDISKLFDAPIVGRIPDFNQFAEMENKKKKRDLKKKSAKKAKNGSNGNSPTAQSRMEVRS